VSALDDARSLIRRLSRLGVTGSGPCIALA
jgi:hypothetical protein